jgi:hypothetical protein
VPCISASFLLWPNSIPFDGKATLCLCIPQQMGIRVVFCLLAIVNDAAGNICVQVFDGHLVLVLLRVRWLGYMVILGLTF